jgi:hypothetical protein
VLFDKIGMVQNHTLFSGKQSSLGNKRKLYITIVDSVFFIKVAMSKICMKSEVRTSYLLHRIIPTTSFLINFWFVVQFTSHGLFDERRIQGGDHENTLASTFAVIRNGLLDCHIIHINSNVLVAI